MITHDWSERHFNRASDVVGRSLALNGQPYTVVGVLPRNFPGLSPADPPEFYGLRRAAIDED